MSELSQVVPGILSPDGEQKKHNWARLKGKVLGRGPRAGRPRAQTDIVRPVNEDIQAFLGPSTPLLFTAPVPPANLRRQSEPVIDAGRTSTRPGTAASLTSRAEQEREWEERQQQVRYKKPPRRLGLKVTFVQAAPIVIGEGGDEAELPATACRRVIGVTGYRKRAQTETRPVRLEANETCHRNAISATQAVEPVRPATGYDNRPLPATPGPTVGDRVAIVAGAIADLTLSTDQGYFPVLPQLPMQLRQPGPNAFSDMSNIHPALRERPKTAPEQNMSFWSNAPALPPVTRMTDSLVEDFARQSFGLSEDMRCVVGARTQTDRLHMNARHPQHRHEDIKEHGIQRPASSKSSVASDRPSGGRRNIPPALMLSYGPSSHPDNHDQDVKPSPGAGPAMQGTTGSESIPSPTSNHSQATMSAVAGPQSDAHFRAPTRSMDVNHLSRSTVPPGQLNQGTGGRRPCTPAKVPSPPVINHDDACMQRQVRPPRLETQMDLPAMKSAFAAARESVRRNFSQPYPITTKDFVNVRRGEGIRPGSSSSSRPSSSQGQHSQTQHAISQSVERPLSRDLRPSPLKQAYQHHPDHDSVEVKNDCSIQQEQRRKHLETELKKEQEYSRAQEQARLRDAMAEAGKNGDSRRPASPQKVHQDMKTSAPSVATPMVRADSAQYEHDASNSALFTFNARTKDFATLVSSAQLPFKPAEMSTIRWLRAAIWWLLGSRTDVNCLRTLPPDQQTPATIRACLNLCKTWWIVTEVVALRLNEINASNMPLDEGFRADLADLFSLTNTVVEAVKGTCLDMVKLDIMPKRDMSTREAGIWPKDVVLEVADENFPEDSSILRALLES